LVFKKGPFFDGTNNIGEFLAIVHALALLKKHNSEVPIFSDSKTAISWVKAKKSNTKLDPTGRNAELFELIKRAEDWLKDNTYKNKILKWETKWWGENPADFGRK
jgi:ribonuclease HI